MSIDSRIREQDIKFGEINKTRIIDEQGSTATTRVVFKEGVPDSPQKVRYEFRIRVKNEKEEHQEFANFSAEVAYDLKMLDPVFKIERTKTTLEHGYYYIVKCYSALEY